MSLQRVFVCFSVLCYVHGSFFSPVFMFVVACAIGGIKGFVSLSVYRVYRVLSPFFFTLARFDSPLLCFVMDFGCFFSFFFFSGISSSQVCVRCFRWCSYALYVCFLMCACAKVCVHNRKMKLETRRRTDASLIHCAHCDCFFVLCFT